MFKTFGVTPHLGVLIHASRAEAGLRSSVHGHRDAGGGVRELLLDVGFRNVVICQNRSEFSAKFRNN